MTNDQVQTDTSKAATLAEVMEQVFAQHVEACSEDTLLGISYSSDIVE